MPKVTVELDKKEYDDLRETWEFAKSSITDEGIADLGWNRFEAFCHDVLHFGFDRAAEDPVEFIQDVREHKSPIFRSSKDHPQGGHQRFENEYKGAYA